MEKRESVGKLSSLLLQQDVHGDITAGEQMSEQLGDYERGITECYNTAKTIFAGDFYIVVVTKRERLMPNVFRNYFVSRKTCPTPDYDQTVYHYHKKDDHLEFLWALPSPVAIKNLLEHRHHLDPSFFTLLKLVLDFLDGSLENKARTLNNEPLIKKEKVNDVRSSTGATSH